MTTDENAEKHNLKEEDLKRTAEATGKTRAQAAQQIANSTQQASTDQAAAPGQKPERGQGIPASDPHQTNQNKTSTVHKTASRTPGEYVPSANDDEDSATTAWANDQQNPRS